MVGLKKDRERCLGFGSEERMIVEETRTVAVQRDLDTSYNRRLRFGNYDALGNRRTGYSPCLCSGSELAEAFHAEVCDSTTSIITKFTSQSLFHGQSVGTMSSTS